MAALGGTITSGTVTLDGTESLTSALRVFRSGVPSTLAAPKSFPGTSSCAGGTCFYETVSVNPAPFEALRINYEWASGANANIFLTAYLNSFNVGNLASNYLGDPGSSVLAGAPGSNSFEVLVPSGNSLVLAFSTVTSTSFGTVSYTVENAIPEPATFVLVGIALGALATLRRVKRR
jgi:PEP-CTERM motif